MKVGSGEEVLLHGTATLLYYTCSSSCPIFLVDNLHVVCTYYSSDIWHKSYHSSTDSEIYCLSVLLETLAIIKGWDAVLMPSSSGPAYEKELSLRFHWKHQVLTLALKCKCLMFISFILSMHCNKLCSSSHCNKTIYWSVFYTDLVTAVLDKLTEIYCHNSRSILVCACTKVVSFAHRKFCHISHIFDILPILMWPQWISVASRYWPSFGLWLCQSM